MPFVLDASVAIAWCFEHEATPYADAVLDRLGRDTALVPAIWPFEVANALAVAERRGRIRRADVIRAAELLVALPVTVESASAPRVLGSVLAMAQAHGLSSYDASYLELAAREGLPIATLDERLRTSARHARVPLLQ